MKLNRTQVLSLINSAGALMIGVGIVQLIKHRPILGAALAVTGVGLAAPWYVLNYLERRALRRQRAILLGMQAELNSMVAGMFTPPASDHKPED